MTITLNGTTGIVGPNGTASAPAMTGTDTDTGIVYGTNTVQVATGGTTAVTVDSSQNVGIGTSSPQDKLSVYQANMGFVANGSGTGTNAINFRASSNTTIAQIKYDDSDGSLSLGTVGGGYPIKFITNNTEKMRIDSSGNLLVGQTASGGNQAAGGIVLRNPAVGSGGSSILISHATGTGNGNSFAEFSLGGSGIGNIVQSTASTVAYNTSSDYRLKENIAPMTGALDKVVQLKPCTYNWKVDGSSGQGFIAHELQAVVPDCVTGEKDAVDADGKPIYQGIDTSFLVATLTAAIQEQQAIITDLKARIETLENK